ERRRPLPDGPRGPGVTASLEVRGLGYALPANGRKLVQNVSFTVGVGETLVLLGRSGSGKTTTLKLINRLLEPTAGDVLVAGERTAALEPTRLRRRIGYVIQEIGLFPHFTVAQNVGLVPRLEGWAADRIAARVRELLTLVGLDPDEFADRYPRALSGGQRQRVGVARALAADPALLLLDEHLSLVGASTLLAVAIGVPLGVLLTRRPAWRGAVLGLANVFQTIPSLALFGFLIPLPFLGGIGARTAIVALVVYALLPIVR